MNGLDWVHWNGELVPAEDASVSVFDAGFLYGDGLYETMRTYSGRVFAFDRHAARIARGADAIDLTIPAAETLRGAVEELLAARRLDSAVVRITVTRGRLDRRLDLSSAGAPSVLVTAEALVPEADTKRRRGIRVIYSRFLRMSDHPLAGVKSTNYQVSLFARNEAREAGATEALVPNESGDIVEGAAANVFLVEGDRITTPPLRSGILGGITRGLAIELARDSGRTVTEETLPRERIERADEVFLTGTTIQITPVTSVEKHRIRDGRPGPVTMDLLDRYLAAVAADTGTPWSGAESERMR